MNNGNTEQRPKSGAKSMGIACLLIVGLIVVIAAMIEALNWFDIRTNGNKNERATCLSNIRQLGTAMQMYAVENNDRAPGGMTWQEALYPFLKSKMILVCPAAKSEDPCYALNFPTQTVNITRIDAPEDVVMFFESVPGMNQCGGKELLPSPPRHPEGHSIGFVDGHARSVKPQEIDSLIWNVKANTR